MQRPERVTLPQLSESCRLVQGSRKKCERRPRAVQENGAELSSLNRVRPPLTGKALRTRCADVKWLPRFGSNESGTAELVFVSFCRDKGFF